MAITFLSLVLVMIQPVTSQNCELPNIHNIVDLILGPTLGLTDTGAQQSVFSSFNFLMVV